MRGSKRQSFSLVVYSLLNLDASVVQPVILDSRRADGPFTTAWSHLFSTSRHLIDVRQIASSVRAELVRTGWAGTRSPQVCLRKAVWGVHGGVSPLSRGGNKKTTCKNAPFLFAFRDFVLARVWEIVGRPSHHQTEWLPLPVKGRNGDEFLEEKVWSLVAKSALLADEDTRGLAREMAVKTLVVTYAIRQRPSRRGPNGGSNLDATQIHGLEGIQLDAAAAEVVGDVDPLKRVFANQQDVVDKLRNFVHAWARQSARYGIQVDFRAIDFATLSFEEQLAIAHGTDFFIGPHGAVFAHLLYLRQMPMAAVLELKPPERGNGNQQFHNLAVKMGNLYQAAPISSTLIDDKQMKFIMEIVQEMLDQLQAARLNSLK
ncbi:hypothetical protein BC830DRAFT_349921 [Chytriomyces sp. MP71]|nr:hypothetical protein BC830DRAFT_349921 [Chytriomyces sp. MP71]